MKPSKRDVLSIVAERHGLSVKRMNGNRRLAPIAHARQMAMLVLRETRADSFPSIGRTVNRDHTTAMFGVKATRKRLADDPDCARRFAECLAACRCPVLVRRVQ